MDSVLDLGTCDCRDASRAGAKAARLALAAAAGLPVLPGFVIPAEQSGGALDAALQHIPGEGLHGARLAVMSTTFGAEQPWVERARSLGPELVVRSSSPWEGGAALAGAFTSLLGVTPDEVPHAVRSVWASALTGDVYERLRHAGTPPDKVRMAVLVQPAVRPDFAGSARREPDGTTTIVYTAGSAAALMAGWDPGRVVRVSPSGDVSGEAAAGLAAAAVAALCRATSARLGDDLIEWAQRSGDVLLLQSRHPATPEAALAPRFADIDAPNALDAARLAAAYAGAWGEWAVLPWAVNTPLLPTAGGRPADGRLDPPAALRRMQHLAGKLTEQAWRLPLFEARRQAAAAWRDVRGPAPAEALGQLRELATPDTGAVHDFLTALSALRAAEGLAGVPAEELWAAETGELAHVAAGGPAPRSRWRAASERARRRWEPFVHAAVMSAAPRRHGVAAVPGAGAGLAVLVDRTTRAAVLPARPVVVADRPWPQLSSLLFGAAALVTAGGSPAAHLVEVATSLGVPSVVGCDVRDLVRTGVLAAVDGDSGTVAVAPVTAGQHHPVSPR